MKRTFLIVVCFLLILIPASVQSQSYPQWEGYPSLNEMSGLAIQDGTVWGATSRGLFGYDIVSGEYQYYYRNHGLDAGDLTAIAATGRYVYIGFRDDGLMRFDPQNGEFEPILFPEYINSDDVTASLAINDIIALNDTILYVAHDKGIDRLNLVTEELRTYSQLSAQFDRGIAVIDIEVFDGKIWAGTGQGLAWADIDNPSLESAGAWESFVFGHRRLPSAVNSVLKYVRGPEDSLLYIATGSRGIIEFKPDTGDTVSTTLVDTNVRSLAHGFGTVVAGSLYEGYFVKIGDEWVKEDSLKVFMRLQTAEDGNIWAASGDGGLQHITAEGLSPITPMNLPSNPAIRDIEVSSDGDIWISTSEQDLGGYIQTFRNGQWSSFILTVPLQFRITNGLAIDSHDMLWGSCWGTEVYTGDITVPFADFPGSIIKVDPGHEFILPYQAGSNYVVNPDITVDDLDNIWVAGFTNGLYVFDGQLPVADNRHRQFKFEDASTAPIVMNVTVDPNGWIWLGTYQTGLIGLRTGTDPYDGIGDSNVYITGGAGSNQLLGSRVYAAVPDLDGDIWVGTDGGLNRIVKHSGTTLEVLDKNDYFDGDVLVVLAITVDETGSKWIGTSEGLYRIGPDNTLTAIYTTSNSGLISNSILSLTYDAVKKRMLIGTDAGLNTFSIFGVNDGNKENQAYVYPNPFEIWGSDSRATFEGLEEGTLLRLYTFNGELVTELEPEDNGGLGAQAVWDGTNYRGEYVGSGIYFYTGKDYQGTPFRSKMAVIRR